MATDDENELIWMRPEPSGRKPRFSRDQIGRAAIALADTHGFDAVTMKRIADELGAGTMTLYYYVRTKADIVALMQDGILTEVLIAPGELSADWREAIAEIARRTRAMLLAHPWSLVSLNDAQFGPNATRHYEQSLAALAGLAIPVGRKVEIIGIVDDFVFGGALHAVEAMERRNAAASNPRLVAGAVAYGERLLATGEYPQLAALSAEVASGASDSGPAITGDALERQFEAGLRILLDGLADEVGAK